MLVVTDISDHFNRPDGTIISQYAAMMRSSWKCVLIECIPHSKTSFAGTNSPSIHTLTIGDHWSEMTSTLFSLHGSCHKSYSTHHTVCLCKEGVFSCVIMPTLYIVCLISKTGYQPQYIPYLTCWSGTLFPKGCLFCFSYMCHSE